jgi:uncharacterized protein YjdB
MYRLNTAFITSILIVIIFGITGCGKAKSESDIIPVTGLNLKSSTTLLLGESEQLIPYITPSNATNTAVTWKSSDETIIYVTGDGLITARALGDALISAKTSDGNYTANCNVHVVEKSKPVTGVALNKKTAEIKIDEQMQLIPTISPSDATNQKVSWSTDNGSIAQVNESGIVTGKNTGITTIKVTTMDGAKTAECQVTVNPVPVERIELNKAATSLMTGNSEQLVATVYPSNATTKSVKWSSSNLNVCTVNSSGVIQAVGTGSAIVNVTTDDGGYSAICIVEVTIYVIHVTSVDISYKSLNLQCGKTWQLYALISPLNATDQNVQWSSSDSSIASVSTTGLVTAVAPGTAAITLKTIDGGFQASCSVTSTAVSVTGISLSKSATSIELGSNETLVATVTPVNATNKNVTWQSADSSIASVDESGKVQAISLGSTIITVKTVDANKTASCSVTVSPVTIHVESISLNASSTSIAIGNTFQLAPSIIPSNATNQKVLWESSATAVAKVDTSGLVTGVSKGTTVITATTVDKALKATCTITVLDANLIGINVTKGILQPSFTPLTTSYLDAPIPYTNTSTSISPLLSDSTATVTIDGNTVASGSFCTISNLAVGPNTVKIEVTAADGITKKVYTVRIYRALPVYKTGSDSISGYTPNPKEDMSTKMGISWPANRFKNNSDGTITDTMTGLMWMQNPAYSKDWINWNAIKTLITSINTGSGLSGYKDWRIPNAIEFYSIINYNWDYLPHWFSANGFLDGSGCSYWTSTYQYISTSNYSIYTISMYQGDASSASDYDQKYSWFVRSESQTLPRTGLTDSNWAGDDGSLQKGVEWPSIRFHDNGDGTVTDNMTNLMWEQRAGSFKDLSWDAALTTITSLTTAGYSDWRMPNINELKSLLNYNSNAKAIWSGGTVFKNVVSNVYWSSTTFANDTRYAWQATIFDGTCELRYNNTGMKSSGYNIYNLAVRGGENQ